MRSVIPQDIAQNSGNEHFKAEKIWRQSGESPSERQTCIEKVLSTYCHLIFNAKILVALGWQPAAGWNQPKPHLTCYRGVRAESVSDLASPRFTCARRRP